MSDDILEVGSPLYRFVDSMDTSNLTCMKMQYRVVKVTPCGYWFCANEVLPKQYWRWVSKTARKRFCYPTIDEAWESYRLRKKRHYEILNHNVDMAYRIWCSIKDMESAPEGFETKLACHGMTLDI